MKDIEINKLNALMSKLEEAEAIARDLLQGIETDKRVVIELEKYTSSSGNTTWKAYCADETILYFRQAQRELFEDAGMWDVLNELDYGALVPVRVEVETLPDGNFHRLVKIGAWTINPNESLRAD